MTRTKKIIIGFFLLIALGIRIHAAIDDKRVVLKGDEEGYDRIAVSLAQGTGYSLASDKTDPTAWRPPLYPLFLASIYRVAGHGYLPVRIVQAILSTLTVLLIVLWAYTLFGGVSACFSALIASVYPAFYAFYFSSTSLLTETLYVLLFTGVLFTLYAYFNRPSWPLALVSGFLWGLSNLTRSASLPFVFVLPLILISLRYPLRQVLRYFGIVWLAVGLVGAPWMIRNYLVFHTFNPASSGIGPNLYGAYHPQNWDGIGANVWQETFLAEEDQLRSSGMSEAAREGYFFKKGLGFIREDPTHALRLFLRRIFLYLDPTTTLQRGEHKKRIVNGGYLFVLAGTVAAFFLSVRRQKYRREILSLGFIFGFFLLLHGFLGASERYRFPNEPILIILASFALSFLPKAAVEGKV